MLRAIHMPEHEQERRMRRMRETVFTRDVRYWTDSFMNASGVRMSRSRQPLEVTELGVKDAREHLSAEALALVRDLAEHPRLIVASDVDGTLSPIAPTPEKARILPEALHSLRSLDDLDNAPVILVSGRSVEGV